MSRVYSEEIEYYFTGNRAPQASGALYRSLEEREEPEQRDILLALIDYSTHGIKTGTCQRFVNYIDDCLLKDSSPRLPAYHYAVIAVLCCFYNTGELHRLNTASQARLKTDKELARLIMANLTTYQLADPSTPVISGFGPSDNLIKDAHRLHLQGAKQGLTEFIEQKPQALWPPELEQTIKIKALMQHLCKLIIQDARQRPNQQTSLPPAPSLPTMGRVSAKNN